MPHAAKTLHEAVRAMNPDAVARLLVEGADPDALDAQGEPPLYDLITCTVGFTFEPEMARIITLLAEAGADFGLRNVSDRLKIEARNAVCSALEANMAGAFIAALEAGEALRPARRKPRRG
jgi:hypothetical protein